MNLNLLSKELGASAVSCSDEFFGIVDALLLSDEPQRPGTYGLRGANVDGWESRRHNPDHDWVVLRLAFPGMIEEFVLDTTGFRFNAPRHVGIDVGDSESGPWHEVVSGATVEPNSPNSYSVDSPHATATFVRLRIFPDGGVARLRAYGMVDVSRSEPPSGVRLSDVRRGCTVEASAGSFGEPWSLISHALPISTHDGWETPRRSNAEDHFVIFRWPTLADFTALEIVASPYRGNCAAQMTVEFREEENGKWESAGTFDVLAGATTSVAFPTRLRAGEARVRVLPDGGVSRVWFYGSQI